MECAGVCDSNAHITRAYFSNFIKLTIPCHSENCTLQEKFH